MKALDLFGEMTETNTKPAVGKFQIWKARNKYREGTNHKCCKMCAHCIQKAFGRNYYKCDLMGGGSSPNSDIRLKMVCDKFEKQDTKPY